MSTKTENKILDKIIADIEVSKEKVFPKSFCLRN